MFFVNKKSVFPLMLACLLTLSMVFVSCGDGAGNGNGPTGGVWSLKNLSWGMPSLGNRGPWIQFNADIALPAFTVLDSSRTAGEGFAVTVNGSATTIIEIYSWGPGIFNQFELLIPDTSPDSVVKLSYDGTGRLAGYFYPFTDVTVPYKAVN
jgi:hypothetical protein